MIASDVIARKRDGQALTPQEIDWFIQGYASGSVPDYQMAAMAMAIYLRGMTSAETTALTHSMLDSGTRLTWPDIDRPVVDKHSTGGVGDKTSLILTPLLACLGYAVPMISGRGLGATGGTLDKLEAIPGFRTDLSLTELQAIVHDVGCVITGTTDEIAPADRELYALRDVTATVASIPLITASIMSKKLAEGVQFLVLDVKYGSGAFMKPFDQARALATSMIQVGRHMQVDTSALLTDMNQPLGRMVGNALEVAEALEVLQDTGPADTRELTLALATQLLRVTRQVTDAAEARRKADAALVDGSAMETFARMVHRQGGDLSARRPIAAAHVVAATVSGYVGDIDAECLGKAVIVLGGGRQKKGDAIDHAVGLEMHIRRGDQVAVGQPLVTIYARQPIPSAEALVRRAISLQHEPPQHLAGLIAESISAADGDDDDLAP